MKDIVDITIIKVFNELKSKNLVDIWQESNLRLGTYLYFDYVRKVVEFYTKSFAISLN